MFPSHGKSGHIGEPGSAFESIADKAGVLACYTEDDGKTFIDTKACCNDLRRLFISTCDECDLPESHTKWLVHHSVKGTDVTSRYNVTDIERRRLDDKLVSIRQSMEKVAAKLLQHANTCGRPQDRQAARLKHLVS